MRQMMNLTEMATELRRQQGAKHDYIADTRALNMIDGEHLHITSVSHDDMGITDLMHRQMGTHLNIPATYYDAMRRQAPALLSENVNHWLHAKPEKRMIRTLDGQARAFLSDRYRRLDNFDLAEAVLPELGAMPDLRFESMAITDRKLYIKAVLPRLEAEVKLGDIVQAGLAISNSEIGEGSLTATPLIFRLSCLNGLVMQDMGMRRYHTGRQAALTADAAEIFSDETIMADDKALWLKVRDTVRAAMTQVTFDKIVSRLRIAAGQKIEADPMTVVERAQRAFTLSGDEGRSVLKHLTEGGDLSAWGLINAITASAQEPGLTYDRATELETLGGKILELPRTDWQELAKAA